MLRGHLEVASPLTHADLAGRTGLPPGRVTIGLAVLEAEGFAIQGRFSERAVDTDDDPASVEWSSRRLLARMHAYSRAQRRRRVEPVTAEQLMRFLVQWQHVTGATQHRGVDGLARVIGQLQGYETAVGAWEPQVLARRVRDYDPAWLDRLCHQGEVTWLRLRPPSPDDPDRRLAGATRTTPVSLVLRADLPWLLAAHRGEASPPVPACGAVAEVVEVLAEQGRVLRQRAGQGHRPGPRRRRGGAVGGHGARPAGLRRLRAGAGRRLRSPARAARHVPTSAAAVRAACVPPRPPGGGRSCPPPRPTSIATSWPRRWPTSSSSGGASCSTTSWPPSTRPCAGATSSGRCAAWRTAGSSPAAGSCAASPASSSRSRRRPRPCRPSAGPSRPAAAVRLSGADPLNLTGVVLPGERVPARSTEWFDLPV